jgi:HAD superfamily hydrolase (TIGR01459 family)
MSAILPGLSALASRYDVIFSDVWGVLHNGLAPHVAAGDALRRFREGGGKVVLISNAPRPFWSVVEQLNQIGVTPEAYDGVVTSGDVTIALAEAQGSRRCYHIGATKDEALFKDLDVDRVSIAEADFALCTGLRNDEVETAEDYRAELEHVQARGLPFLCANPDLVVERGNSLLVCAGAIAELYASMGGTVLQAGKPHPPIYAATRAKAEVLLGRPIVNARILAVGDAIRTDVAGAAAYGIDSLFLSYGIHASELHDAAGALDPARLKAFLPQQAFQPKYVQRALSW